MKPRKIQDLRVSLKHSVLPAGKVVPSFRLPLGPPDTSTPFTHRSSSGEGHHPPTHNHPHYLPNISIRAKSSPTTIKMGTHAAMV